MSLVYDLRRKAKEQQYHSIVRQCTTASEDGKFSIVIDLEFKKIIQENLYRLTADEGLYVCVSPDDSLKTFISWD